eukprot:CAMPEP_0202465908 /NCGR_PEP_ID=MMETSP1360-20130828/67018_1 /ASSEMBLY_ACC=CAM_ASM_000848 /TAXON_ID=515479 /ORGANISM="Licmophora paradoxa, Strain CCMP2313" /LENGTH=152 /DNA_ID=CAMNT_0049089845 /DNA_START=24 /DNA_END=479 /DNA_ORIENTATION=-
MHARALQEIVQGLENSSSESLHILDVGCGSGYLTACLGECVNTASPILKTPGKVYGIDVFPNLIDLSQRNIQEHNSQLFDDGIISLSLGDGWKGLQGMCFDAIHVGAAASTFPPELMQQLKVGGVMIIPVGEQGAVQVLYRIKKLRENKGFD